MPQFPDDQVPPADPDFHAAPPAETAPVGPRSSPAARVPGLDVVRGVALLGILILNIVNFAWPARAYESVVALFYTTDSVGEIPDPDAEEKETSEKKKKDSTADSTAETKQETNEETTKDSTAESKKKTKKDEWMFLSDPKQDLKGAYPGAVVRIAAVSSEWDVAEWAVARVFFANKMRTLFCLLFGAGLVYLTDGLLAKGVRPVWLYYRRMFLLLIIGLLHGALVWQGDILFGYAAVGLYLYPFRRLRAKTLGRVSLGLFLAIVVLIWIGVGVFTHVRSRGPVLQAGVVAAADRSLAAAAEAAAEGTPADEVAAGDTPAATARDRLENETVVEEEPEKESEEGNEASPAEKARNEARKQAVEALGFIDRQILRGYRAMPRRDDAQRPEILTREIRLYRDGAWLEQVKARVKDARWMWLAALSPLSLLFFGWLMILGMSLAKSGFFAGEWPEGWYRFMAFRLVPLGWILEASLLLLQPRLRRDSILNIGLLIPAEQAIIPMISLGYAAAIILLIRSGRLPGVTHRLAMVGRMALSNYLAQSLICTFLFYSHGLGLFGSIPRVGLVAVVLGVWAVELWWSPRWFAGHLFGPVEWCWRSLASMKRQPWRRPETPRTDDAANPGPPRQPITTSP